MEVKILDVTIYDKTGTHYHTEETPQPTWPQIEAAIRALDRYERPFVTLLLHEDTGELGYLSILGGDGAWALSGTLDGETHLNYFDGNKSDEKIDIWTSDQGYYPEERYVCYDLALVLRLANHFAQSGAFSPAVTWENT